MSIDWSGRTEPSTPQRVADDSSNRKSASERIDVPRTHSEHEDCNCESVGYAKGWNDHFDLTQPPCADQEIRKAAIYVEGEWYIPMRLLAAAPNPPSPPTDQPRTFACHHALHTTCMACEGMVERWRANQSTPAATPNPRSTAVDPAFLADLDRSRAKYPSNGTMLDGLLGEVHELKRAYNGDGDIRSEAFDVAVCAYRIAVEGDAGGNKKLSSIPDSFAWDADQKPQEQS